MAGGGLAGEGDLAVAAEQTFGEADLRHRTHCRSKARPHKPRERIGYSGSGLGARVGVFNSLFDCLRRLACSSLPGSDVGSPEKTTTSSTIFVSGRV